MDEFERLRRSLHVPDEDEGAKRRARVRLDAAIDAEQRGPSSAPSPRTGRRWARRTAILTGAAAALALILVLTQALLPSEHGGPPLTAAGELERLGEVAANSAAISPGGGYLYTQTEQDAISSNTDLGTGATWDFRVRQRIESWVAADGSGRRVLTVESVSFASDEDRRAWIDAGRPERPEIGQTVERYGPGELPRHDVGYLPADPDSLRDVIHSGRVVAEPRGPLGTFFGIGELLLQPDTPPGVRRGLFDLASRTPGITVAPVTDPLGRTGEGFTFSRSSLTETLIVDPSTAEVLAVVDTGGAASGWRALVRTAQVPTATARP